MKRPSEWRARARARAAAAAGGSTAGQRSAASSWRGRPGPEEWRRAGVRGGEACSGRPWPSERRPRPSRGNRAAGGAGPLLRAAGGGWAAGGGADGRGALQS